MSQDGEWITIYIWPEGTYCLKEDLEDYLTFMSDDYEIHEFEVNFKDEREEERFWEDYFPEFIATEILGG